MLAILITLTPGRRYECIDCHNAKLLLAEIGKMDVKTRWNSTLQLLKSAYRLWEFTREWLQIPTYSDHWPLSTTQDECTIFKYVMELFRPFRYWILWMSKRHTVTLHHVITVDNDMFDHMDGVMRPLARKKTRWKEDLFFAVKSARPKLSKYYAVVTLTTGKRLISAHILDPFRKLRLFRKWDKEIDINPEDETSYTIQYKEAFLKYVENEYHAKHWRVQVNNVEKIMSSDLVPSEMASAAWQLSFDPSDWSSDNEEYLRPTGVPETTPRRSDRAARLLTAARLHLNSPPAAPKTGGGLIQISMITTVTQWTLAAHFGYRT